ncbi:MAG: TonB-dependent receptor [Chitinophagaceae bacterium]|nr:TonB-dependent receptor [Chitinophagaceae bacterium]
MKRPWMTGLVSAGLGLLLAALPLGVFGQCVLSFSGSIEDADTHEKLEAAVVTIRELRQSTVTNEKGFFQFNGLCPGSYNIEVSHVDCQPLSLHIHLKEDLSQSIVMPHKASQLSEVVVVGTQRSSVTGITGELKGKQLDLSRGLSLGESLKQVSGVSVLQTGTNIYKPVIHGLHSNRVLILNNGIRQEGQQWGSEHAPEIDPFIANRITVVKGASSIRYGGDAIGGVILVEPKLLRYAPGMNGEVNAGFFSNNLQGVVSAMFEGNSPKHPSFAWRLQGTAKRGGSARTPDYWLANSALSEFNGSATAGWRRANKGLELFYSIFNTKLGIFTGAHIGNVTDLINAINGNEPPAYIKDQPFTYAIDRPYQQVQHHLGKAKAFLQTGDYSRLNIVLSTQYNRRREYDIVRTERSNPQLELNLVTGMADIAWDHYKGKHWKGTVGGSAMYQWNDYSYRYFIPNYQAFHYGAFIAEKYLAGKWQLEGGLRYDHRQMFSITDNDKSPFDELTGNTLAPGQPYGERRFSGFSGNLGALYRFNGKLTANLTFASAWRAPQVNEMFSNGLHHGAARIEKGKADLATERANSILAGVQYEGSAFSADISLYHKQIDGFIYLKPTYPPELTIRGAFPTFAFDQTDARLTGMDLQLSWMPSHHIRLTGKGSILRAFDRSRDEWLIQMPADRGELAFEYLFGDGKQWKQSWVKASMQYVSEQTRVPDSGNIEITHPDGSVTMESDYAPPPPAYTLFSLEGGTDLTLWKHPLTLSLTVTNLFNRNYRDYMNAFRYFADDMGRNVVLRVKWPFDIH